MVSGLIQVCSRDLGVSIQDDGDVIRSKVGFQGLKVRHSLIWEFRNVYSFDFRCLSRSDFSVTMVETIVFPNVHGSCHIPLRCDGVEIAKSWRAWDCPPCMRGTQQLQPIYYHLPVASAQVKSALIFAALQAGVNLTIDEEEDARTIRRIRIRQFGGEIQVTKNHSHPGWDKSSKVKQSSFPDILVQAFNKWLAYSSRECDQDWKMGINQTRTGILDVIQEMGRSHH